MTNPMKEIRIEKVTLNIGVGEAGSKLEKVKVLLETITQTKAVKTQAKKRIPTWNLRPKLEIACKVTVRKKEAESVLKRLFQAVNNELPESKFDNNGNFSFGIKEYIDIPKVEYIPELGIIGLEAAVTLERPGFRVKKRIKKNKIGTKHKIKKQEAIEFIKNNFNVKIKE
ncbi:MAG: 50S ribosomal protein L5 [archaeon]